MYPESLFGWSGCCFSFTRDLCNIKKIFLGNISSPPSFILSDGGNQVNYTPVNLIVVYFNKIKMALISQLLKGENNSFMPEGVFIFNKDFHLKSFFKFNSIFIQRRWSVLCVNGMRDFCM